MSDNSNMRTAQPVANAWDYPQTQIIGFGLPKNPENFRLGINTLKNNTLSHEAYTTKESKIVEALPKYNEAIEKAGLPMRFHIRPIFDKEALANDDDSFV